ncbi:hypothetical protein V8G54_010149 [Vigna mungo]|uniref:Uncharacterized protein n=1 Tax=Vigna mungo TaxID=3915 RepID=A0AAQ3NYJ6_VIGMU
MEGKTHEENETSKVACPRFETVEEKGGKRLTNQNKKLFGSKNSTTYAEVDCKAPGADTSRRVSWMKKLILDAATRRLEGAESAASLQSSHGYTDEESDRAQYTKTNKPILFLFL